MDQLKDSIDQSNIDRKAALEAIESFLSSKIQAANAGSIRGKKNPAVNDFNNPPIVQSYLSEDEGVTSISEYKNGISDPFYNIAVGTNHSISSAKNIPVSYQPNHTDTNRETPLIQRSIAYFKNKTKFLSKMDTFTSALIPAAITLVITNSAQPLLIFLLRKYGGTPVSTRAFNLKI